MESNFSIKLPDSGIEILIKPDFDKDGISSFIGDIISGKIDPNEIREDPNSFMNKFGVEFIGKKSLTDISDRDLIVALDAKSDPDAKGLGGAILGGIILGIANKGCPR